MLAAIVLVIGLLVLVKAANTTIAATERIAAKKGWSNYGAATILIAMMTSLPELFVSVLAALRGDYAVVTGTVFGSVVGLLLLSLGLIGLIANVRFTEEERTLGRRAVLTIIYVAILAILLPALPWFVGILVLLGYLYYAREATRVSHAEKKGQDRTVGTSIRKDLLILFVGIAFLLGSAEAVVWSIETLAREYGIAPFVISFILVALGTNLPEISVEITSAIKNKTEIALGDIVGSAVADSTVVLGTAAIVAKTLPITMTAHVGAAILLGSALLAWKIESGEKLTMWESLGLVIAYFLVIATEMALG